ncbi:MAG: hypothetical protein IPL19_22080 [Sandaracinaceae bacterium]|nr:hypothetical protein [Sandaracinaceae bacterium]MBK7150782.1 hypothetical protein [Sandaracinaceae bacterium]MBK7777736.1 hypothetical protein [Sandaracinaceae bacterium]MBK8410643.1 hypothetical protein [Sandaracinaceae bacterium]
MSYDLMVFDPALAPVEREAFLAWYRAETEWREGHGYDDPSVSSPALRAWFLDMISSFPAMNGPFAPDDIDDDDTRVTDYSVGKNVVYASFAWSVADEARAQMVALAEKHRVGFFDASGDEHATWRPHADGTYRRDQG